MGSFSDPNHRLFLRGISVHHLFAVAMILVLSFATRSHAQDNPPSYRIIVNAHSPIDSLDRRALADMFSKK